MKQNFPDNALYKAIDDARYTQGDDTAAFLCFLGVRLLEMHQAAHGRNLGKKNFQNEIIWTYTGGTDRKKAFRKSMM